MRILSVLWRMKRLALKRSDKNLPKRLLKLDKERNTLNGDVFFLY